MSTLERWGAELLRALFWIGLTWWLRRPRGREAPSGQLQEFTRALDRLALLMLLGQPGEPSADALGNLVLGTPEQEPPEQAP